MRILLVEDDETLRDIVVRSLRDKGHAVDVASSMAEAARSWRRERFDAVLLDLGLPCTSAARSGLGNALKLLVEIRTAGA